MNKWLDGTKLYGPAGLTKKQIEIRDVSLNRFEAYIRLVAPYQLLSRCHVDLCRWIEEYDDDNRLLLWPRDHGKSRTAAFYAAWEIVRDPATTQIYASATAEKAEEQLRFIKAILDSKIHQRYFPGLIHPEEGRRASWNVKQIIVDHPLRASEGVVDSTIMTCGLEKTITGKHCRRLILDDVVVPENNTEQGRKDVNAWVAQAASIMSGDSSMLVVGTRYHPRDAYQIMIDMHYEDLVENEDGEIVSEPKDMFRVSIADVETDGEFLWPRQQRKDGKWFGFNKRILSRKRAVYEANNEITQFYAQYYNDPNDKSTAPISRDLFRYYEKDDLDYSYGLWTIEGRACYVYAGLDLAATTNKTSDYTVLTVGAIDDLGNRYLLAIKRMRTAKMSDIHEMLRGAYEQFRFKKLRIEAVGGFRMVAQDLADRLQNMGIRIPIDLYVPPNTEAKAVRVNNILEPLYQSGVVYHYRGGNVQVLEDELVSINPINDDTKDSWAMTIDLMRAPIARQMQSRGNVLQYNSKFGGVAYA